MKKFAIPLASLIVLSLMIGTVNCANVEEASPSPTLSPYFSPTPTPSPELTPTVTPKAIDWASIAERIERLASQNGLIIYEVKQLTDDIVEIATKGECKSLADAIKSEPDFEPVGTPQLSPQGICTAWFRVLPTN